MQQIKTHLKTLGTLPALAWLLMPLTIYIGTTWDGTKAADKTQMFLGASNNLYLLFLTVAFPVALYVLFKVRKTDPSFALTSFLFSAWAMASIVLSQSQHFLTFILWVMTLTILGMTAAHRKNLMLNPDVAKIRGRLSRIGAWIALACALAAGVHLLGPWPEHQIFLYVDGFSNIRTFGETALLSWLILTGAVLMQKNVSPIYLACIILASALIFWSGTRAAWVGMFAALLVTVIATRTWSRSAMIIVATLLGLGGSLLLPLPGNEYGAWRFQKLAQETSDATQIITQKPEQTAPTQEDERPKSVRTALWKWGFGETLERPLTGHGMGAMQLDTDKPKYLNFAHLHNIVLDMAYWYGWPMAALLFGWMTFQWVFLVAASWKRNPLAPTFLMMSTGLAICALFAGTFMFPITLMAGLMAFSSGRILFAQKT